MLHESDGFIPLSSRKGRPAHLFQTWFASNMQLTTIVTGALAAAMHISVSSAIIAIILGNLIGAAIMGLHAAQGPRMTSPQMGYSREQFGTRGAAIPIAVFILMYIGFYASTSVIGGQMLVHLFHLPYSLSVLILNFITVMLVYLGFDVISAFQRYAAYLYFAAFAYISFVMISSIRATPVDFSHPTLTGILVMLPVAATWQLSYTPYVSDYSRYLPPETKVSAIWLSAGTGTFISTVWMMLLGAVGASGFPAEQIGNGSFLMQSVPPELRITLYLLFLLGIVSVNVFNLYGGFMASMAVLPSSTQSAPPLKRASILLTFFAVCTIVSLFGSNNFLNNYSSFLNWLLYFLIPWSAINLVDFYVIKNGVTSDPAAPRPADTSAEPSKAADTPASRLWSAEPSKAAIPAKPSIRIGTFVVYSLSVGVEFVVQALQHWNHNLADISHLTWLIGFICGGALYYWMSREIPSRKSRARSAEQD